PKPIKRTLKQDGRDYRSEIYAEILANESEETKAKILRIAQLLDIRDDDAMWFCILVVTHCRLSVAPLPELAEALQANLRDFKASVYDVRRETDKVAHLLQRKLGGIQQMPVSRAVWTCALAGFFGTVLGITAMGGLLLFAVHNDCNLETFECPKPHIKSNP
ncbi:MAG TPA: hypothetical protein ACFE0H_03590, partial [Elainellaceae cyanobacterium]